MFKKIFIILSLLIIPSFTNAQFAPTSVYNETQSTSGDVIQTMIDAANSGDVIRLEGPFGSTSNTFTENVVIDKPLTLYGVSSSTIIIDGDGTGNPITINASNVTVRDLTVTNAMPDSDAAGVRVNSGYSGILIDSVIAASSTSAGIHVTSGDSIIRNCITNDNIWGIRIDFDSNFTIDNCLIYDNNRQDPENSAYGQGIRAVSVSSSTISNNTIYNNARQGILITEDGSDSSDILIEGNTIYNNGQAVLEGGIEVDNAEDVNIEQNNVYSNNGSGINLVQTILSNVATNTIFDNTINNIKLFGSDNNTVAGNDLGTSTQDNLMIEQSDSNDVENNEIYNTQNDKYALNITGTGGSSLNYIFNNIIRNNANGLKIENSSNNNTVSSNEIYESASYAFRLSGSTENMVIGNNIYNNPRGIRVQADGNTLYDNIFSNTINSYFSSGTNIWNVADILGPNILGGSYFGGNQWSNYGGVDGDGDGFGDTAYDTGAGLDNKPLVSAVIDYKEITYLTDGNGTISGSSTQMVAIGEDATTVTAVANPGFQFSNWDGDASSTSAERTDLDIMNSATFTAYFTEEVVEESQPESNNSSSRSSGTTISGRITNLERIGKIKEANALRDKYNIDRPQNIKPTNSHQMSLLMIIESLIQSGVISKDKAELARSLANNSKNNNFNFTKDLQLNDVDEQVRMLQKFLNSNGYVLSEAGPGSPGNETNIFGTLTQSTLMKFQKDNNISPASGYFGPITRNFIKNY